jgi:hypothetical protein
MFRENTVNSPDHLRFDTAISRGSTPLATLGPDGLRNQQSHSYLPQRHQRRSRGPISRLPFNGYLSGILNRRVARPRSIEKFRLADDGDELKDMFGKCDIAGYRDFGASRLSVHALGEKAPRNGLRMMM